MKKSVITLLLYFICVVISHSQSTFYKLIYFDFPAAYFTSVLPTDSCFYVTGTFTDTLIPTREGILIAKLGIAGELLLSKTIKHPDRIYTDTRGDLIAAKDGSLVKVGLVGDTITRALLIKYDTNGDTIFTQEYLNIAYPNDWNLLPMEVRQKPDGEFVVLITSANVTHTDISVLTVDTTFNATQYQAFGSNAWSEFAASLLIDEDGGNIIGGSKTNVYFTLTNFIHRTYIFKTDSIGQVQWEYLSPSGILQAEAKAIIKTPDGGLVVASGKGIEVALNASIHEIRWDAFIFKLDADRNVVWSTPLRGVFPTQFTELRKMVAAKDGSGYVAVGKVAEDVSVEEPMAGSWIVKVSPEGDSLWARYYTYFDGVDLNPYPYDMKQTPDGGYVVVGLTSTIGDNPGWIMKVDSFGCLVPGCQVINTSVETGEPEAVLSLYPNPTSDFLHIFYRLPRQEEATFTITDAQGRQVYQFHGRLPEATHLISVREWAQGSYFICMETGASKSIQQFVITK